MCSERASRTTRATSVGVRGNTSTRAGPPTPIVVCFDMGSSARTRVSKNARKRASTAGQSIALVTRHPFLSRVDPTAERRSPALLHRRHP
jgi:hypothetical protein